MKTLHSSFHLNGHSLGVSIKTLIWLDIKILLEIPKWTRSFRERCRCAVESWTTTLRYGLGTVESKIPQLKHFSQLIMIVNLPTACRTRVRYRLPVKWKARCRFLEHPSDTLQTFLSCARTFKRFLQFRKNDYSRCRVTTQLSLRDQLTRNDVQARFSS